MTDNEIIKALEGKLPLGIHAIHEAIDLINRQKAEIESLQISHFQFISDINTYKEKLKTAKAEAVKEFAERYERYLLSQLTTAPLDKKEWINFCLDELGSLKKEMVGES